MDGLRIQKVFIIWKIPKLLSSFRNFTIRKHKISHVKKKICFSRDLQKNVLRALSHSSLGSSHSPDNKRLDCAARSVILIVVPRNMCVTTIVFDLVASNPYRWRDITYPVMTLRLPPNHCSDPSRIRCTGRPLRVTLLSSIRKPLGPKNPTWTVYDYAFHAVRAQRHSVCHDQAYRE